MPILCKYQDCKTRAAWGFKFQQPEYCHEHGRFMKALPQYKICMCGKSKPLFGFLNNRPCCCKDCRTDNMEDLVHKKCIETGCAKRPHFGIIKPEYCSEHKKNNMTDITHVKCKELNCNKRCHYGAIGERPEYCTTHKKENMVHMSAKRCDEVGCEIISRVFDFEGGNGKYCNLHKKEGMIDVLHKKCIHEGCSIQGSYNYENEHERKYCKKHKKDNMVNIISKKCPGPPGLQGPDGFCPIGKCGNPKYNYYCCECFSRAFPSDPRTHLVHKKSDEILVRDFITSNFPSFQFIHDKSMWIDACDCSHKRRVDIRALIGNIVLVIEVDENQHKDRDSKDEEIRYDDLYMIHSGKWIFIRYNPHLYKDSAGKRANPWKEKRLRILRDEIQTQLNRIQSEQNTELVEIHKLFFDGFRAIP